MHRSRIEVAVVATCLLIVASLVPPALLAARDRQREQLCQDRLRRLSAAFVQYESAHGGFPPRRSGFNDGNAYGGWGASIYNYLGVTEVEGKYDVRYDFFDPQNKVDVVGVVVKTPLNNVQKRVPQRGLALVFDHRANLFDPVIAHVTLRHRDQ